MKYYHTTPRAQRDAEKHERAAERERQRPPSLEDIRGSAAGDAIRRIDASRFCAVCGSRFTRKPDEKQASWSQRDKCDKCRAMKLSAKTNHKYCRHCGTLITETGRSNICPNCTHAAKDANRRTENAIHEAKKLTAPRA